MTKKETGYSLLEVSVALGIAAIVATAGVIASTTFLNDAGTKSSDYVENADESILNAEEQYLKTIAGFWAETTSELEDVNFTAETAATGQALFFDGNAWINTSLNFEYLAEVLFSNLKAGDVLTWDGENWVNGEAAPPAITSLTDVQISQANVKAGAALVWDGTNWVNGSEGAPGMTMMWTSSSIPEGWLIADGRAVSRTTYSELFDVIGVKYGEGDGSTTFNLPDLSGRVGVGIDSAQIEFASLGTTGGVKAVTLTEAQLPVHTHTQQAHGHTGSTDSAGAHTHTGSTDSAGAHTHTGTVSSGSIGAHTHTASVYGTATGSVRAGGSGGSDSSVSSGGCCTTVTTSSSGGHSHSSTSGSAGEHSHSVDIDAGGAHTHDVTVSDATAVNNPTGGGQSHTNVQPYLVLNYIIKH